MFRLIARQRRRLAFAWFFLLLTVGIMFFEHGGFVPAAAAPFYYWPVMLLAALILTGTVIAGCALFILAFPRWRQIVELVFLMAFLQYTLAPGTQLTALLGLSPDLSGFADFAVFMALYSVTYGTALDRFRFKLDWKSRRRLHLPQPPEDIWPAFALSEHGPEQNWTPILHDAKAAPEDPESLEVTYRLGPSIYQHQTQTVLDCAAPAHYRYYFMGDADSANRSLTEGIFDVTLSGDGKGGTRLEAFEHHNAMLPRTALLLWFDDHLGDALDSFRARTSGRRDWSITGITHREIMRLS